MMRQLPHAMSMPCPTRHCATLDHWVVLFMWFWMASDGDTLSLFAFSCVQCRRFPLLAGRQVQRGSTAVTCQTSQGWIFSTGRRLDRIDQTSLCRLGGLGAFGVHESRTQDFSAHTYAEDCSFFWPSGNPWALQGRNPAWCHYKSYIYICIYI